MIRRQFLKLATLTSATGLASLGALDAFEKKEANNLTDATGAETVNWRVHGFSCVTCAMGLQVMLQQQKGVKYAQAAYPSGIVTIQFHPHEVSEAALRSVVAGTGFTVEEQKG